MAKIGAFEIVLFFVCLNLSCWLMSEIQVIPFELEGIENPTSITSNFEVQVFAGITLVSGGILAGLLVGSVLVGAVVALTITAITFIVPTLLWVINGLPMMLVMLGVPSIITTILGVLISMVFMWFIVGLLAQRRLE